MQPVIFFILLISTTTWGYTLLDLHDGQTAIRTYSSDNFQKNEDGTISFRESESQNDGSLSKSNALPLIEAPVAMSNPIVKILSRANYLYQIFRRNSRDQRSVSTPDVSVAPHSLLAPKGWQFFL